MEEHYYTDKQRDQAIKEISPGHDIQIRFLFAIQKKNFSEARQYINELVEKFPEDKKYKQYKAFLGIEDLEEYATNVLPIKYEKEESESEDENWVSADDDDLDTVEEEDDDKVNQLNSTNHTNNTKFPEQYTNSQAGIHKEQQKNFNFSKFEEQKNEINAPVKTHKVQALQQNNLMKSNKSQKNLTLPQIEKKAPSMIKSVSTRSFKQELPLLNKSSDQLPKILSGSKTAKNIQKFGKLQPNNNTIFEKK